MPAAKLRPVRPSDAFHHSINATVPHAETLAGHTANVSLTAGGTIKSHVADDDIFLGREGRAGRRIHNQATAR
jgi:hypothetical protein